MGQGTEGEGEAFVRMLLLPFPHKSVRHCRAVQWYLYFLQMGSGTGTGTRARAAATSHHAPLSSSHFLSVIFSRDAPGHRIPEHRTDVQKPAASATRSQPRRAGGAPCSSDS